MKLKRSYIWAVGFAAVIGMWLASGIIGRQSTHPASEITKPPSSQKLFKVRAQRLRAQLREAKIVIRGRTEASRRVDVRAQTAGVVIGVPFSEGAEVSKGDLLCSLELSTRAARLAEAKAKLAQAELDLNAANQLAQQNFLSKTKRAAEQAKYDAAAAGVALMEREIEYTSIRTSEAGTIEKRPAEPGSFLQVGGLCATVTILNPLRVIGNASEREISSLREGMKGEAYLISGETVSGALKFVSPTAEQSTRTFRIELEVPNRNKSLRDGLTAEIRIPLPKQRAHLISPANLTLNDSGQIGVKIVDKDGYVRFREVKILADGKSGVWISGLPDEIALITVGQEYVIDGQKVDPVFASKEPSS